LPENWRHDHRDISKTASVLQQEKLLGSEESEG
jgi:hypothetical protein